MSEQQQWIQVPPPNPYSAAKAPGRGLAIAAMAVGLVAILTTAVAAFYFSVFVLLGALIGLVAIVLGIIALVIRQRPKGASITGLVAGALALILAIATGSVALAAMIMPDGPSAGSGDASAEPQPSDPGDDSESLLVWPANMATGGLAFGPGAELLASPALETGATPAPLPVARNGEEAAAPNDVHLYVDYRCPHCAEFEQTNGGLLEEALQAGTITVEVTPLAFVDRNRSALASAAMACIADAQPEVAWAAHETLLGPAAQADADGSAAGLATLLDGALSDVGGLSGEAGECIQSEHFVPFAQALSDWGLANPVPNASDPSLTVSATPTILVNGVPYQGSLVDPAEFRAFLDEQTR